MTDPVDISKWESKLWGTAAFDGCGLCRRNRSGTAMISDRHYECLQCRAFVRKHHPESVSGPAKVRYVNKLKSDDSAHKQHCQGVVASESRKRNSSQDNKQPGNVKVKRISGEGEGVVEDQTPNTLLQRLNQKAFESRQFLGVLWPVKQWEAKFERKAKPNEIVKVTLADEALTGVIRNTTADLELNCRELWSVDVLMMQNIGTLHDSSEAVAEDETERVVKFAMNKMKCSTEQQTTKEGEEYLRLKGGERKRKKDDMDALDDLWSGPTIGGGGGDKDKDKDSDPQEDPAQDAESGVEGVDEEPAAGTRTGASKGRGRGRGKAAKAKAKAKAAKASRGGGTSLPDGSEVGDGQESIRGSACTATAPSPSPKETRSSPNRRAKELQITEELSLRCEVAIRDVMSVVTFLGTSEKKISALISKANLRLSSAYLSKLSVDIDSTSGHSTDPENFDAMERLMHHSNVLSKLLPLAKLVNPVKGRPVAGGTPLLEFKNQYNDWKATLQGDTAHLALPLDAVHKLVVERELDLLWEGREWDKFERTLRSEWAGDAETETPVELRAFTGLIPLPQRDEFKERQIVKGLLNLVRASDRIDDVKAFVLTMSDTSRSAYDFTTDGSLQREWKLLTTLLWPMRQSVSMDDLRAAKLKVETDRQLMLYRPLFLFATGKQIIEGAAVAVQQRAQDSRLNIQLDTVKKSLDNVGPVKADDLVDDTGKVTVPNLAERQKAYECFRSLVASASPEFLSANSKVVEEVREALTKAAATVIAQKEKWMHARFDSLFEMLGKCLLAATTHTDAGPVSEEHKAMNEAGEALLAKLNSPTEWLESLASKDEIENLSADVESRQNACRTLSSVVQPLCGEAESTSPCDMNVIIFSSMSPSQKRG